MFEGEKRGKNKGAEASACADTPLSDPAANSQGRAFGALTPLCSPGQRTRRSKRIKDEWLSVCALNLIAPLFASAEFGSEHLLPDSDPRTETSGTSGCMLQSNVCREPFSQTLQYTFTFHSALLHHISQRAKEDVSSSVGAVGELR